ncbi:hypothetical protein SBA3_4780005 [Candidatus Sulfopaludibacter sp. SbA3]|nr:hypothetical protein SBA3_4780005 [Candidatus Sulfopaludibacter sp. SbA3]
MEGLQTRACRDHPESADVPRTTARNAGSPSDSFPGIGDERKPSFGGPAVPNNQIHDFHPPIAESGLYWVAAVPPASLKVAPMAK